MLGDAIRRPILRAASHLASTGLGGERLCRAVPLLVAYRRLHDAYLENARLLASMGIPDTTALDPRLHAWYLPPQGLWTQLLQRRPDASLASRLDAALAATEACNPSLDGCLTWWKFTQEQSPRFDETLRLALSELANLDLATSAIPCADVVGPAYEILKAEYAPRLGARHGEFYTPHNVVRLMVEMNAPEPGKSILDPCCGTGGMLAESALYVRNKHGQRDALIPPPLLLCGQDISREACALAMCNLVALGYLNSVIVARNALTEPLGMAEVQERCMARYKRTVAVRSALLQAPPDQVPPLASVLPSSTTVPQRSGRLRSLDSFATPRA